VAERSTATVVGVAGFAVDDVVPAGEALPTRALGELFADALAVGGDPALPVLAPDGVHPLLSAVGRAFAEHRPLVLTPDAVWLTIAQGVAQHVRLHAEELRPRLVSHAGRKRLGVVHDGPMPTDAESWGRLVASFGRRLTEETADAGLFACDFSTSTDVERVAGQIVLLDAYSPYFSQWLTCICGIPSITLTGTVADWCTIRQRVDELATFGLDGWRRSLAPIADEFVRAAVGSPDIDFWRRIYNPADAYGGEVITGWAARLYPYLKGEATVDRPNPLLTLPIDEPRGPAGGSGGYAGPGVRSDAVPATLSRVIVDVNDRVERDNRTVALHGGLVAVAQDTDGALRPVAGWYLSRAEPLIDDVIDRIVRDHQATAPSENLLFFASGELAGLYRGIGSATLFDGAWRLLPASGHGYAYRGDDLSTIVTIIELADGRSIGAAMDDATETLHWLVCRVERSAGRTVILRDHPADVPVYGTSLTMLLAAALETGGAIDHLRTGRLEQLDRDNRAPAASPVEPLPPAASPVEPLPPAASTVEPLPPDTNILEPLPPDTSILEPTLPPDAGRPQGPLPSDADADADIVERIAHVRRDKEGAIDRQDFARAADLRERERQLLIEARRARPPAP
jgi:hypothetical protein